MNPVGKEKRTPSDCFLAILPTRKRLPILVVWILLQLSYVCQKGEYYYFREFIREKL